MEKFFWLDTDIGPDCDDAAALAIFLSLAAEGRAIPLGITHCTGDRFGLPTIDAIQRAFGVSLPLGTCSNAEFLKDASVYTRAIAERFAHNFPENQPQPDALCAMRNEFSAVPDGSVTLIGIGPMINLARALQDCETRELFVKKIDRLVLMAGCFGRDEPKVEWNIEMDVPAARIVLEQFPGRIDFCPFEAAADVLTGACLARYPMNPVFEAYRLFTHGTMLRPSWDLATVAAAILGAMPPFSFSEPGNISINEAGKTRFAPDPVGRMRILKCSDPKRGAEFLESLLERAILKMNA